MAKKNKLSKKEQIEAQEKYERMAQKWIPQPDREYIITDSCFWETNPPEDYNPHDTKRAPHSVQLVDRVSGTIVNLPSGSVIKILSVHK